ncbi:MAG TPA: type 1 glutamine amidotransferase domain-containing protein [Planctomycetota bacterium]|nr:type 1 glutamine amidotransferase domain-containing protein [Planctomycetota bacterium]
MAKVAVLIEALYQDMEVWYPYLRLKEEGHDVVAAGTGEKTYVGKYGYPINVDAHVKDLEAAKLSGIVIPGGWAPDKLRLSKPVLDLTRAMVESGKVVAAICHAGWVLASAGVCKGRELTSFVAIKDDLVNAGARWVDKEVVRDGNLITSRTPADLPAFMRTTLSALRELGKG